MCETHRMCNFSLKSLAMSYVEAVALVRQNNAVAIFIANEETGGYRQIQVLQWNQDFVTPTVRHTLGHGLFLLD